MKPCDISVLRITNRIFNSNSFLITTGNETSCFLIDIGDFSNIKNVLGKGHEITAVFLTHGHFDHIYGLNELISRFPKCKIYASSHTFKLLHEPKLNFSRYHETDFTLKHGVMKCIDNMDSMSLWGKVNIEFVKTPGHDAGCITYIIGDYIFTGDSYIPGVKTVTNLRGNKQQATESVTILNSIISERNLIICPGHGDIANGLMTSL